MDSKNKIILVNGFLKENWVYILIWIVKYSYWLENYLCLIYFKFSVD